MLGIATLFLSLDAALASWGGGGGGMGGGGGIIDPPVGALFKDPVEMGNLSNIPRIVNVHLEAKIAPVSINGTVANLMTFNGFYPGPTIRARKGDTVHVKYTNSLSSTTETNLLLFG